MAFWGTEHSDDFWREYYVNLEVERDELRAQLAGVTAARDAFAGAVSIAKRERDRLSKRVADLEVAVTCTRNALGVTIADLRLALADARQRERERCAGAVRGLFRDYVWAEQVATEIEREE